MREQSQRLLLSFGRVVTILAALSLCSCVTQLPRNLHRFEFTRPEMGLPFRVVLYAPSTSAASEAAEAAFARVSQLNSILSDYDSDSELSRLSRTSGSNREIPVSDDLWNVLSKAQEYSRKSGGAFDITVGPLVNLWRNARREQKLPRADWPDCSCLKCGSMSAASAKAMPSMRL